MYFNAPDFSWRRRTQGERVLSSIRLGKCYGFPRDCIDNSPERSEWISSSGRLTSASEAAGGGTFFAELGGAQWWHSERVGAVGIGCSSVQQLAFMYAGETCPRAECRSSNDVGHAKFCCSCMAKPLPIFSCPECTVAIGFFPYKISDLLPTCANPKRQTVVGDYPVVLACDRINKVISHTAVHKNKLSDPKSGT